MADQPVIIGGDPYTMQLQDIAQRKAMAQALQQQSLAPAGQTILHSTTGGDLVVRNGIAPALGKISEAYFGNKMLGQQNEAAQGVLKQQGAATSDWMQQVNQLQQPPAPNPLQAQTVNQQAVGNTPEAAALNQKVGQTNQGANQANQQDYQDRASAQRGELLAKLAGGSNVSPIAGALGGQLAQQMLAPKPNEFTPVDLGDRIMMVNKTTGAPVGQPLPKNASPDVQAKITAEWKQLIAGQQFTGQENTKNRATEIQKAGMEITASTNNQIRGKDEYYTDPNTARTYVRNPIENQVRDAATGQVIDPKTGASIDPKTGQPNGVIGPSVNPAVPGAPAVAGSADAAKNVQAAVAGQAHIDFLRQQLAAARQQAGQGGVNTFGFGNSASDPGQTLNSNYNAVQGAIIAQDKNDAALGRLTNYDAQKFLDALPNPGAFAMTQNKYMHGLDQYEGLINSQEKALHDKFPTYGLGTNSQVKPGQAATPTAPAGDINSVLFPGKK